MKIRVFLLLAVLCLCFSALAGQPNIVFILCDDLGIGDLGCYGQEKLKTPNIDSIAASGMKFANHYSGSTVCAPSRSCLMTGQHTGHTYVRGNRPNGPDVVMPELGQLPLPADYVTLPKLLKQAGYATGMFGKWGLGGPDNSGSSIKQGFDEFMGYYCQSRAHSYYPPYIWHNTEKVELDGNTYSHDLVWNAGLDFIRQQAQTGKPFFTYYSITVPHAAMTAPPELHEKWCKIYPQFNDKVGKYNGKDMGKDATMKNPIAGFAAMIDNLDNQVGQLIDTLKKTGVYENTILVFTSDNGAHSEGEHDPEFWNSNGPFQGIKRDLYDGGVHVPLLVSWPKHIKPGSQPKHISAFWDWLPTFAELGGATVPANAQIDGISMAPLLTGKAKKQKKHDHLYWEFAERGPRKAIRAGKWKMILTYEAAGTTVKEIELFNLDKDIAEASNLAGKYPEKVQELKGKIESAHTDSEQYLFKGRAKKQKKKSAKKKK